MSKKNKQKSSGDRYIVRLRSPQAKAKKISVRTSEIDESPFLHISLKNMIPLGIAVLVFLVLWFKLYDVKMIDPWYEGIVLIDSAQKVTDRNEQNRLLDEAGEKISGQVRKHPYHARIHFLYGYYWFNRQNWDSVIFQQKEAIRIGAGGVVNQIEYDAQGMLNSALGNKVMGLCNTGNFKEAFDELEKAKTPNMNNPGIDKYRGIIYSMQRKEDSALVCFFRYMKSVPNDVDNLTNIGISYARKSMIDSSLIYVNRALQIDPDNANAKSIKSQIAGPNQYP